MEQFVLRSFFSFFSLKKKAEAATSGWQVGKLCQESGGPDGEFAGAVEIGGG
jgi:hypothetical protein